MLYLGIFDTYACIIHYFTIISGIAQGMGLLDYFFLDL